MTDLGSRISALSPAKRTALLERLAQRNRAGADPTAALPTLVPGGPSDEPFGLTAFQEASLGARGGRVDLTATGANLCVELAGEGVDPGPLVRALDGAVQRLVACHSSLRLRVLTDGRQALPDQAAPFALDVHDLRGTAAAEAEVRLDELRRGQRLARGDPGRWPLFDLVVVLLDGQRARVLVRLDELVADAVSFQIVLRDLFRLLERPELPLTPLSCSFRDYVHGLDALGRGELFRRAEAYWRERVPRLPPPLALPQEKPVGPRMRSEMPTFGGVVLDSGRWQWLRGRAARAGLTPTGAVVASFIEVVRAWSRQPELTVSLVTSFRLPMHPDVAAMTGDFNSLVLLGVAPGDGAFVERARRVQRQMSSDVEHLYYPGARALRDWRRVRRCGSRLVSPVLVNSQIEYSHAGYEAQALDRFDAAVAGGKLALADMRFSVPGVLLEPVFAVAADGSLESYWYGVAEAFPDGMIADLFEAHARLLGALADGDDAWSRAPGGFVSPEQLTRRSAAAPRRVGRRFDELPCQVPGEVFDDGAPTGLVGRYRPDGSVDVLGPPAALLDVNGYRVWARDLEARLASHPGVTDAVVATRATRLGAEVVAWVARGETQVGDDDLRAIAITDLPCCFAPAVIVQLAGMPRRTDGTIDRERLPPVPPSAEDPSLHPAVVAAWTEVLGAPPAGADDELFACGGTSLDAARLIARIELVGGVALPTDVLTSGTTAGALSASVRRFGRGGRP